MSIPGKEVFRCYDEWGPVSVYELPPYRYLAFGEGGEQSCMLMGAPHTLVHQYAQAMMLALLVVPAPGDVLVLGLGAGSLVNALLTQADVRAVTVVELRRAVVNVATEWFSFMPDQRLQLVISDARDYLGLNEAGYDLLMADLYTDEGMDACLQAPEFLADCYHSLNDDGVLVLNLWGDERSLDRGLQCTVGELFDGGLWLCPVEEGNIILFAFKGRTPELAPRRLLAAAKLRAKTLGYPLNKLVFGLKPLA
ncbi:spermidine synthase [Motiliproteus sediminis]|uniref:spermidine synthase n=1 Tax=Motiliproteus sediminis TaxID=1468178 RepID=UPI001AEF77E5|nr:fused MFS/spermidine synthase [Motiliproteus sediminis]